jgi:signal peptidase II
MEGRNLKTWRLRETTFSFKPMILKPWKRIALILMTLIVCVGCDQKTKSLARESLRNGEVESFLGATIRLDCAENPGSFLGLGASLPDKWRTTLLTYGCTAGVVGLGFYVFLSAQFGALQVLALSLIVAGGIGNVIARWTYGYAIDFLNLGLGPVRTGIFNIADLALTTGCFLVLLTHQLERLAKKHTG